MQAHDLRRRTTSLGGASRKQGNGNSSAARAFYELPIHKQTPAEIIKESRNWLQAVSTRRPQTPRDRAQRSLFGQTGELLATRSPSARLFNCTNVDSDGDVAALPLSLERKAIDQEDRQVSSSIRQKFSVPQTKRPESKTLKFSHTVPNLVTSQSRPTRKETKSAGQTEPCKLPTEQPQLELRGVQTKLLKPTRERLISPVLSTDLRYAKGVSRVAFSQSAELGRSSTTTPKPTVETVRLNVVKREFEVSRQRSQSPELSALQRSSRRQNSPADSDVSLDARDYPLDRMCVNQAEVSDTLERSYHEYTTSQPNSCMLVNEQNHHTTPSPPVHTQDSSSEASGLSSGNEMDYLVSQLIDLSSRSPYMQSQNSEITVEAGTKATTHEDTIEMFDARIETKLLGLAQRLYDVCLNDAALQGKRDLLVQGDLLKALFGMLNHCSPRSQLALIRLLFKLEVTGTNLNTICRLLYQITKDSKNDVLYVGSPTTLNEILKTVQLVNHRVSKNNPTPPSVDTALSVDLNTLLFLTGTLKFLSLSQLVGDLLNENVKFRETLLTVHRCTEKRLRFCYPIDGRLNDEEGELAVNSCEILLQITEIFCHSISMPSTRKWAIEPEGAMDHFVECLLHMGNSVSTEPLESSRTTAVALTMFNWVRLLARLSESADVCGRLENLPTTEGSNRTGNLGSFCRLMFNLIEKYWSFKELLVRIAYLLGNLSARLDTTRMAMLPNVESVAKLCTLCRRCLSKKTSKQCGAAKKEGAFNGAWDTSNCNGSTQIHDPYVEPENAEFLNKLIRVLANSTINESVGHLAVVESNCLELYLDLIAMERPAEASELLVNCLAGLNNLTYYINAETRDEISFQQYRVAETILTVLSNGPIHADILLGCIRVLGNLTRLALIRDWLVRNGDRLLTNRNSHLRPWSVTQGNFVQLLLDCLSSPRSALVYSTLGVLVNLMADPEHRPLMAKLDGLTKLLDAIRDFAGHDWQLVGLACKTLWNYTENPHQPIASLLPTELVNELYALLSELTDEQLVARLHEGIASNYPSSCEEEPETIELSHAAWYSEFLPVATELLSRLSS